MQMFCTKAGIRNPDSGYFTNVPNLGFLEASEVMKGPPWQMQTSEAIEKAS